MFAAGEHIDKQRFARPQLGAEDFQNQAFQLLNWIDI